MDILNEFWVALSAPDRVDVFTRLLWLLSLLLLFIVAGLWIGQFLLGAAEAFYPAERFRVAAAWSLLAYVFVVSVLLTLGWYLHGKTSWAGLTVHIPVLVVALLAALMMVPSKGSARA